MNNYFIRYLLLIILNTFTFIKPHSQIPTIKKIEINSPIKNDFAPYIIDSVIYFSSNRKHELFKSYLNSNNEWVYRLYKAPILANDNFGKEKLVQNSQLSKLNTPTICWSNDKSTILITQNQYSTIQRSKGRENLFGIFFIDNSTGKWSRPSAFEHNSRRNYSNAHPTITPDGKTIFFVSNMPGGFGQSDLYESNLVNGEWTEPVNLGKEINSAGYELFPFYHHSGKLFFSSEGHNSLGKLDIFYTSKVGNSWIKPVHLEHPINTEHNDFSCFILEDITEGYFASDRAGNDNIYKFSNPFPTFPDAQAQIEDNFCFTLFENGPFVSDTLPYKYKWIFGDGESAYGLEVDHCFPGPGYYKVELNVVDTLANKDLYTVASYELNLDYKQQIYISCKDTVQVGALANFSTEKSVLKDFVPKQYYWYFGDGNKGIGETITHIFRKKGIYTITCGAVSKDNPTKKMSSTQQIVVTD